MAIDNSSIQEFMEEVTEEPNYMAKRPKPQVQELELLNLAKEEEDPRPIFISKDLSKEKREALVELIREFVGVFA